MDNSNRSEKEKGKTNSVGWKLRALGFIKVNTGQGKGWLVDRNRLKYLEQIYEAQETSPEKGEKGQEGNSEEKEQPFFNITVANLFVLR